MPRRASALVASLGVALLLLLFDAKTAEAQSTSRPSSTAVARLRNATSELVTLDGTLTFTWTLTNLTSDEDDRGNMTVELTSSRAFDERYVAVSWATGRAGAGGAGFACVMRRAPQLLAHCRDVVTEDNAVRAPDPSSDPPSASAFVVSSARLGDNEVGWSVVLSVSLSPLRRAFIIDGRARVLFARGVWLTGAALPGGHGNTLADRAVAFIDFEGGSAMAAPRNDFVRFKITLFVALAAFVAAAVGAAWLRTRLEDVPPNRTTLLRVAPVVLVATSYLACVAAAKADLDEHGATVPFWRAVGAASTYLFGVLFFPLAKMPTALNLGHIAGSSFARLAGYHAWLGVFVGASLALHATGMIAFVTAALPFRDSVLLTTGTNPPGCAFAGALLLVVVVAAALLRRRAYALFRAAHLLVAPALVLFVVHFPLLAAAAAPAASLYLFDLGWRLCTQWRAGARVVSASYDVAACVTTLSFSVADVGYEVRAGQCVLLTVPAVSWIAHPFTAASFDANERVVTLHIRNTGGAFTARVAELAASDTLQRVFVTRPFGQLSVRVNTARVLVIVVGGIGATCAMNVLCTLARDVRSKGVSALGSLRVVRVVWAAREAALVELLVPHVERCLAEIAAASGIEVACVAYLTCTSAASRNDVELSDVAAQRAPIDGVASDDAADAAAIVSALGNGGGVIVSPRAYADDEARDSDHVADAVSAAPRFALRVCGRPNIGDVLSLASAAALGERVAVVACGPAPLLADVRQHATRLGCLLHEEGFAF
jgi:ferredoxin-NADP reductase